MELVNGLNRDISWVFELTQAATSSFERVEGFRGVGWYFWDETETCLIGPFSTSDRAETAMIIYLGKI